jgi:hypothetical protein
MSEVHRIRLRGPWNVTAIDAQAGIAPTESITMPCPCSWREGGWPDFHGRARHRRRFGKPARIDSRERVWLIVEACRGALTIELNGAGLGSTANGVAFESDVTHLLSPRNEVQIDVTGTDDNDGLTGEVRLEIRSADERNPIQAPV